VSERLILGVGHPHRGDDAAGLEVVSGALTLDPLGLSMVRAAGAALDATLTLDAFGLGSALASTDVLSAILTLDAVDLDSDLAPYVASPPFVVGARAGFSPSAREGFAVTARGAFRPGR